MIKIRSITDVITNSSSEVFILKNVNDDKLELWRDYIYKTYKDDKYFKNSEYTYFGDSIERKKDGTLILSYSMCNLDSVDIDFLKKLVGSENFKSEDRVFFD